MKHFLAFDLGASSGRAIIGALSDSEITIREVHRFENGGVELDGKMFWDLLGLFSEIKTGLRKAMDVQPDIAGVAVDTWGVDYALIDKNGNFVGFPRHYRDPRTANILPFVFDRIPKKEIYSRTGIQFMNLNTIFQLAAMKKSRDPSLDVADKLLLMPNALTYMLCGNVSAEYTIATTTQLYDPQKEDWAWNLIEKLEIPKRIFPEIVAPGTLVGTLTPRLCDELKCNPVPVILTAGHDTASAVAAVPADSEKKWAYLSSGTWSLLGLELDKPIITESAREANYTNEGGVDGKIRFLKNIMGLWLIQESRAEWQRQGTDYSFGELCTMAEQATPFRSIIDPNNERFAAPGNMPARIAEFCEKTGQPVPETPGQVVRCALESLALRYRQTLDELEELSGASITKLHLVGGGCQNQLLNQFTANAAGRAVVTGPVEATALGNLICQGIATGAVGSLKHARRIIRASVNTATFLPEKVEDWHTAYIRYRELVDAESPD